MTALRSCIRSTACRFAAALLVSGMAVSARAADKPAATATSDKPALVDLNTATAEQLEAVPGIGAVYAKKIIAARPYASVKELSKSGIPASRLGKLETLVTVAEKAPAKRPAAKTGTTSALVNINTATQQELEKIKGVSAAYAKRIIAARPYATVKDLSKSGIPASRLVNIVPQVTVSTATTSSATTSAENTAANSRAADKGSAPASRRAGATAKKPADEEPTEARTPPQKGMVWVNTSSKVYHMEGDKWYGKTKKGEWMTEADAIKAGFRKAK